MQKIVDFVGLIDDNEIDKHITLVDKILVVLVLAALSTVPLIIFL